MVVPGFKGCIDHTAGLNIDNDTMGKKRCPSLDSMRQKNQGRSLGNQLRQ